MNLLRPGRWVIASILLLAAMLAGCGSSEQGISANDPAFAGLPSTVVSQRLSDPAFQEILAGRDNAGAVRMAQFNIAATVFCRGTLTQYERWVRTGQSPTVPSLVTPTHPTPGFTAHMTESWADEASTAIRSGDPAVLRSWLLLSGGCSDVVADPTVNAKTTIGDALLAGG